MTKDCTLGNYRSKQHFISCEQLCLGIRQNSSPQAKGGGTGNGNLLQVMLCRSHQKLICIPSLQYATGNLVNYLFCIVLIVSDLGRCQSKREVIYFKHTQWFPAEFFFPQKHSCELCFCPDNLFAKHSVQSFSHTVDFLSTARFQKLRMSSHTQTHKHTGSTTN